MTTKKRKKGGSKIRISLTGEEARIYRWKKYLEGVIGRLVTERNKVDRRIAEFKKKIPRRTLESFQADK